MTPTIEQLAQLLRMLPGVGQKTAKRYVYALLKQPADQLTQLADTLMQLKQRLRYCRYCFNWTEDDICSICLQRSGAEQLCVVESPDDIVAIERTGRFHGRYHVLHGHLDPMSGVQLSDLTIEPLITRLQTEAIPELLLALSPTREGEATSRLIATLASDLPIKITQLAYGLPLGTHIQYLDDATLALALEYRRLFPMQGR